jgi:hypothetical protein
MSTCHKSCLPCEIHLEVKRKVAWNLLRSTGGSSPFSKIRSAGMILPPISLVIASPQKVVPVSSSSFKASATDFAIWIPNFGHIEGNKS